MASLKTYWLELRNFGIRYVWEYRILGRLQGRKRKHEAVTHYLQRFYRQYSMQECRMAKEPNPYPGSIWVCWWQGEEQMPEVVRICYASLLKHANGHPVHLITKDNYRQYVEISEWVMQKFKNGIITITHFSDLLRLALLSRYGGFWMDATLYLTRDMPSEMPYFFTLKQQSISNIFVSNYRWSGYCMGGTNNNPIFSEAYDLLVNQYWSQHNRLLNYFILDYVYDYLYQTDESIRKEIDANPYNNPDVNFLYEHLSLPYKKEEWEKVCEQTYIHKLSWKETYSEYIDNKETYYNKILHYGR